MQNQELRAIAVQVRRDIVRMVHACQSGHPGGSLGCADLFVALYFQQMKINNRKGKGGYLSFNMDGTGEDLFFLSNGHISPVFYSTLARRGYFDVKELATFRKIDSRLQGHPTTHEHLPGIRVASGSLGQGLSVAIGAALAKRLNGDKNLVYCLMGDGEQQEGQVWEAAQAAPHHKLDNLIAVIDLNGQQIDGPTEKVMSNRDLKAKYKAFGWNVIDIKDGNDMDQVVAGLRKAKRLTGKGQPIMILLKTEMGAGVDYMMGSHKWHGVAPNDEQLKVALDQLVNTGTIGDY
ncbi:MULTISPECIES: transketolase [unclassified Emticicia]|uniref:transketolase n=1 Tax=unclassified Emticicia TaxID=2627301 RepID=UPI000C77CC0B|nr:MULTISPECIES: transketolase [unclassified Emticicia]PLK45095.1 transketolase [Emticicia sp. TH156]UTA67075.1 transketolase [Emticicia sp. 21SJ11W-3]